MRGISRLKKRVFGGAGEPSPQTQSQEATSLAEARVSSEEIDLTERQSVLDGLFEEYSVGEIVDVETTDSGKTERVTLNDNGRKLAEELYKQLSIEASFNAEEDGRTSDFEILRATLKEKYAFYKQEMQAGRITKNELTAIRRLFQSIRAKMQMEVTYALAAKQQEETNGGDKLSLKDAFKLARKAREEIVEGNTLNAKSEFVLDIVQEATKSESEHEAKYETGGLLSVGNGKVRLSLQGKEVAQFILDKALSLSANETDGTRLQKAKEIIDTEFLAILNDSTIDEIDKRAYRRIRQSVVARLTALAKKEGVKLNATHAMTEAGRVSEEQQALFLREASKVRQELAKTMQTEIALMETEAEELVGKAYAPRSEGDIEKVVAARRKELSTKQSFRERVSGFGKAAAQKGLKLAYITSAMIAIAGTLASSSHIEVSARQVARELQKGSEQGIVLALNFDESGPVYDQPRLRTDGFIHGADFEEKNITQEEPTATFHLVDPQAGQEAHVSAGITPEDEVLLMRKAQAKFRQQSVKQSREFFAKNEVFEKLQNAGVKVEVVGSNELLLQYPHSIRPLWYGGDFGDVHRGSEDYKGKEENMMSYMQEAKGFFKDREFRPGDIIDLGEFFHPFDKSKYVDTAYPGCTACGACWGLAGIDAAIMDTKAYGLDVFKVIERHEHDHVYFTYTDPKYRNFDKESMAHWTGGPTIWKGTKDYKVMINPELAQQFPGYEVRIRIIPESYKGSGPDDPTYSGASIEIHLVKNDLREASGDKKFSKRVDDNVQPVDYEAVSSHMEYPKEFYGPIGMAPPSENRDTMQWSGAPEDIARPLSESDMVYNFPGRRSPEAYAKVINHFNVEDPNNERYQAKVGDDGEVISTYCNIFVQDVTRAMGVWIPHWVNGKELSANSMYDWLASPDGKKYGWKAIPLSEAQSLADRGVPVVGVVKNREGSGHTWMVMPSQNSEMYVAQAGLVNLIGPAKDIIDKYVHGQEYTDVMYYVNDKDLQSSQTILAKKDVQPGAPKVLFAPAERSGDLYKPENARFAQGIVVGTPSVEQDSTFVKSAGRIERLITSEEATASFRAKRPTFYALGE